MLLNYLRTVRKKTNFETLIYLDFQTFDAISNHTNMSRNTVKELLIYKKAVSWQMLFSFHHCSRISSNFAILAGRCSFAVKQFYQQFPLDFFNKAH